MRALEIDINFPGMEHLELEFAGIVERIARRGETEGLTDKQMAEQFNVEFEGFKQRCMLALVRRELTEPR